MDHSFHVYYFSINMMASGVVISAPRLQSLSRQAFRDAIQRPNLLFYEEGLTATVSVAMPSRLGVLARKTWLPSPCPNSWRNT